MSNVLIELTGSLWGTHKGKIIEAMPHPTIAHAYTGVPSSGSFFDGVVIPMKNRPGEYFTVEEWGGRIVEKQKTYTVVTHQSVARVYRVKASSPEEAHKKATVGDAGHPVSETWSRVERTVL